MLRSNNLNVEHHVLCSKSSLDACPFFYQSKNALEYCFQYGARNDQIALKGGAHAPV